MNHLGRLMRNGDKRLANEIEHIEFNQRDERIFTIYEAYKDNPKIKWKDSIKKIVGIEPPPRPGMDI